MNHKKLFTFIILSLIFSFFIFNNAKADPANPVPVSGWAWSDGIGWIQFNTGATSPVTVATTTAADGLISGYAWSDNIGWISFNASDVAGCNPVPAGGCQTKINLLTGQITGWARAIAGIGRTDGWDGWIELSGTNHSSPDFSGTGGDSTKGVTYASTTGKFSGFAWGSDVIGWIDFSGVTCAGCRGDGVVVTTDMCPNITGEQSSIPSGMVLDSFGNCITSTTDMCPNITGEQSSIPSGMVLDSFGNCITPTTDMCPNIPGSQSSIPSGMVLNVSGNCVPSTPPGSEGHLWIGGMSSYPTPGLTAKQVRTNQSVTVSWNVTGWTSCKKTITPTPTPAITEWINNSNISSDAGTIDLTRLQPADYTLSIDCGSSDITNTVQIRVTDPGTGEL